LPQGNYSPYLIVARYRMQCRVPATPVWGATAVSSTSFSSSSSSFSSFRLLSFPPFFCFLLLMLFFLAFLIILYSSTSSSSSSSSYFSSFYCSTSLRSPSPAIRSICGYEVLATSFSPPQHIRVCGQLFPLAPDLLTSSLSATV